MKLIEGGDGGELVEDVVIFGAVAEGAETIYGGSAVAASGVGDFEAEVARTGSGLIFAEVAAVDAVFGVGGVIFRIFGVENGEIFDDGVFLLIVLGGLVGEAVADGVEIHGFFGAAIEPVGIFGAESEVEWSGGVFRKGDGSGLRFEFGMRNFDSVIPWL